jgi:dihydropyrimidine dehydrogenase (NADP+)
MTICQGVDQNGPRQVLSITVNGLNMPNPFVIGSGHSGTSYTVMKRLFDEGSEPVIAKTKAYRTYLEWN